MDRSGSLEIERFFGRYSIGQDSHPHGSTGSPHFLRIKIPGGFVSSFQFIRIAELAKDYGKGQAEITNRQSLQLHWIEADTALTIFSKMEQLGFTTDMCGQGFVGARYGDPRNIVCCPASGIVENEIIDGRPLLKKLTDFLIGNLDFLDMPRKFKISISGCRSDCTRGITNDLAFVAIRKNKRAGFTLLLGGGVGSSLPGPRFARQSGVFLKPEDAFDVAIAALELHRDYGNRENKSKARFKYLIEKWGINKFLAFLEKKSNKRFEDYKGPVFIEDNYHEAVQSQKQDGIFFVNIPIVGGRLSSEEMIQIANLAKEYGDGSIRLTPSQNIIITNVRKVDSILESLEDSGFKMSSSKIAWNSMGCASDFCGRTSHPHAKKVLGGAINILMRNFSKKLLDQADFGIHVSGCSHNCCATGISGIGMHGRLSRKSGVAEQTYDIALGGRLGDEARFGRVVEEKVIGAIVPNKIVSLITRYLENRNSSENLANFCNRHKIGELRKFLEIENDLDTGEYIE